MKKKPYTPHRLKAVMATLFALLFGVQNVQAQEAYAVLNGGTLTFYYDTSRSTRTGTTYDLNAGSAAPDWYSSRLSVTKVEFNSSFGSARPTTTAHWFDGMTNLTSVRGSYYLNTSETTDMQLMFHDCSSLTSVTVSDFRTNKVTNMQLMFSGCSSLTTLNLSGWNVSNVTIMYQMFTNCSSLTSVNVLGWNTSSVTDMSFMFQGCSSLTTLDLSSWTTPQVEFMSYMFRYCTKLATIYIGKNWGINANVYDAEMFVGCTSLVGASGTQCDGYSNVTSTYARLDRGSTPGYMAAAPYAILSTDGKTLTFYDDGDFDKEGTYYSLNSGSSNPRWYAARTGITNVVISPSFASARPTTNYYWFYEMTNLTDITGLENLNTSEVTSMKGMFDHCEKLTSIDVSHFNTEKVTTMHSMFYTCRALKEIDVTNFETSRVIDLRYMFGYCNNLKDIDLRNFVTTGVNQGISSMFQACTGLTTLDLSSFDTKNMMFMSDAFNGCSNLTTIYVSDKWSNAGVTNSVNGERMFTDCTKLVGEAGTAYDAGRVSHVYARIDGGTATPGYLTNITSKQAYAVYTAGNTTLTLCCDGRRNSRAGTTFYDAATFLRDKNVEGVPGWNSDGTNANVTAVVIDPSFADVRPYGTCFWFSGMTNLTSVTGLEYLNTSENLRMQRMFADCKKLQSLDLSTLNTSKVTSMREMFNGCEKLTTVGDLSGWDISNVSGDYGMRAMFQNCKALQSLNLKGWNTAKVKRLDYMFYFCQNLTSLDLSGWNTEQVTDMSYMFTQCKSLTSLDLGSFNTENVTKMTSMFYYCSALKSIYVSSKWTVTNVTSSDNMFAGCTQLKGGAGTAYDATKVDKTYARIDGGTTSTRGYLTGYEAYGVWNEATKTFTHYYDGKKSQRADEGEVIDGQTYDTADEQGYPMQFVDVEKMVYDPSVADYPYKNICGGWYCGGMENLTTIEGLEYVNTSEERYFGNMFTNCKSLKTLDLSTFDTRKATNMSYMFYGCTQLESLTLGENFSTANVTDMSYMLGGSCFINALLAVLDHDGFTTENVTNMSGMFSGIQGTNLLSLEKFNTAKVTNMNNMFDGCSSLTTIVVGFDWTTAAVTTSTNMFRDCTQLVGGAGTAWSSSHLTADYAHIDGGTTNPGYLTGVRYEPYVFFDENTGVMTFYADGKQTERVGTMYNLPEEGVQPVWTYDGTQDEVTKVVFDPSFITVHPTSLGGWFMNFGGLEEIEGLENLVTSEVTGMQNLFQGCMSLTALDLTTFNTQNVTDMSYLFWECRNLQTVYVGSGWTTANVNLGIGMFYNCTNLVGSAGTAYDADTHGGEVEVRQFAHVDGGADNPGLLSGKTEAYVQKSEDGHTITFYYDAMRLVRAGTTYDLNTGTNAPAWATGFNSSIFTAVFDPSFAEVRPTTTYHWFYYMVSLADIQGLEYLNTSEVKVMNSMFYNCRSLTTLDLSSLDTQKTTDFGAMFRGCSGLKDLNLFSVSAANRISFNWMFGGCTSLEVLDLSHFNTAQVYNMTNMFNNCTNLKTIYVGDGWDASGVADQPIFTGCTSLVGGAGTAYDPAHVDKTYAIVDGGADNPGYLTYLGAYAVFNEETLTFYYDGKRNEKVGTVYNLPVADEIPGYNAYAFTKAVFDASFANARPTSTRKWFIGCASMTEIEGLKNLNTSEVTDMNCMFAGCSSLTTLDLSHFNTAKVTDMNDMFNICTSLKVIYVGDGWSTEALLNNDILFYGCVALVGGEGTEYDVNHKDKSYAHIDGGTSNPGYFTAKPMLRVGDVNEDGVVSIADVTMLTNIILGKTTSYDQRLADVNLDGMVTVADLKMLVNNVLGKNTVYVDLGLPSGTLWQTCNVASGWEAGVGTTVRWGETGSDPNANPEWTNYFDSTDGTTFSKYYVGGKTVLDLEDDAANHISGSAWRMPSYEQAEELVTKCTWTGEEINGEKGARVTGPNGNSIFLPVLMWNGEYYVGLYWLNSLWDSGSREAQSLQFRYQEGTINPGLGTTLRSQYLPVRGVHGF